MISYCCRRLFLLVIDIRSGIAHVLAAIRDLVFFAVGHLLLHLPRMGYWFPSPTPGYKVIHPGWLSKVLQRNNIHSVVLKPLDENRGFIGSLVRVQITSTEDGVDDNLQQHHHRQPSSSLTSSLILKTSYPKSRKNLTIGAGGVREGIFYGSLHSNRLRDLKRIPQVFYSHGSHVFGEEVLLMEDLRHCTPVNHLFGNQIWGIPSSSNNLPKKVDQLELLGALFTYAAEMHAPYWNDSKLLQCTWMRSSEWFHGRGKIIWQVSMDVSKQGWERLKNRSDIQFPKDFVKILDASYQESSWEHVCHHLQHTPFTLTHGDYHAANMVIDLSSSSSSSLLDGLKVLDWSEIGPWEPTTDLAQPVISDVPKHLFPQVEKVLKKSYYEQLLRLGVEQYDWRDCRTRFGESGMERWIWVLGVMACLKCPTQLYQYFVDQMESFRQEFCPDKLCFQLKTCGYVLPFSLPT